MDQFSIVFVCSGNRFRSPLAQAFVERLTLGLPVQISSAGTLELDDVPALPEARQIAVLCGVDLSRHRSQRLSSLSLENADLVIGFEEEHVRRAIVDAGARRPNSFKFREFVSLIRQTDPAPGKTTFEKARAAVGLADDLRRDSGAAGADPDVPDPFGRSRKVQREIAAVTWELSIELVEHVFAVRGEQVLLPVPERLTPHWRWRSRRLFR